MSLRRDSLWAAGAAIASSALRFLLFAALARLLSKEAVGAFVIAQWVADMAAMACSFGLTSIAPRYLPELRSKPEQFNAFRQYWRKRSRYVLALATVVGVLGSLVFNRSASLEVHLVTGLWAFSTMALSMETAVLTGLQRYDLILRQNLVLGTASLILVCLVAIADLPQEALLAAMCLASGSALLSTKINSKAWPAANDNSKSSVTWDVDTKALRAFALNSWVVVMLWSLAWSRGELPVLAIYQSPAEVAQFSAALVIVGGATQAMMLGVSAVGPHITRLRFSGQQAAAQEVARNTMSLQLLTSCILSLLLIFFGKYIVVAAFGAGYSGAAGILSILAVSLPALSTTAQSHLIQLQTDGRTNRNLLLISVATLYAAAFTFIPWLGNEGAAWARFTAMMLYSASLVVICLRLFGMSSVALANLSIISCVLVAALLFANYSTTVYGSISGVVSLCALLLWGVRGIDRRPVFLLLRRTTKNS